MGKGIYKLYAIAILAILIYSTAPVITYAIREPIKGIVTQTHTFLCNNLYLLEINVTFYMTWVMGYSNNINISVKAIDPLPPTRITVDIVVDKVSISKFLGYLEPQEILYSSINVLLAPPLFQIQGGAREVKEAQLNFLFIEPRCAFTIPIWFILSASNTSLETTVWVEPNIVEVNSSVPIYVELRNPTHEPIMDIELYVYVNRSLIRSARIDVLYDVESVRVNYIPTRMGIYVVEVEVIYTMSYVVRRSSSATAIFMAKGKPSISISSNTTLTYVGRAILLSGAIEPRTGDSKVVRLEVSADGMNWGYMGKLEAVYRFNYTWIPTLPGVYYIRANMLESQLFYSALSNIVMVVVERVKPSISISAIWPYIELDSKAVIKIDVSPPIIDTVEVLYRLNNESSWNKMISRINRETSTIEFLLTKPGVYEVKVVVPEGMGIYRAESNTIQLYVTKPKTLTMSTERPSEIQEMPYRNSITIMVLIVASTAIALLILMLKKR